MVSDGTQSRARAPPGRGARSTVCVCGRVGAAKPYHCSDPTIETETTPNSLVSYGKQPRIYR